MTCAAAILDDPRRVAEEVDRVVRAIWREQRPGYLEIHRDMVEQTIEVPEGILEWDGGLEFALGFSHPVAVAAPAGITFAVESPTKFSVIGIDKQQVGEVAANIRKIRKPEPYKGKGVRYSGENVRRKVGKAGK